MFDKLMELIDEQKNRIKELEQINEEHRELNGELREENERLKKLKERYQLEKEIYKTRNEKAIETIELWDMCGSELITTFQEKAINILQGSDE